MSSPTDTAGRANVDFVIFPPRWMVAEDTYRPPWFHRNVMSEFMGLIHGKYDARKAGFAPGGCSLHNKLAPHGNDAEVFEAASKAELKPDYYDNTQAFMFETSGTFRTTAFANDCEYLQRDYAKVWQTLKKHFSGGGNV
jgi:homogentisate 1,2-dioxygenase